MLLMLSFIYYTVWKLWHWGCLFFWVSKLLTNQSLAFKGIFSVSFYVHHKMKQKTLQWSEHSTQVISLQSRWGRVTGRMAICPVRAVPAWMFCSAEQFKPRLIKAGWRHMILPSAPPCFSEQETAASHLLFSLCLWDPKLETNRVAGIELPYFSFNFYFNPINGNPSA